MLTRKSRPYFFPCFSADVMLEKIILWQELKSEFDAHFFFCSNPREQISWP